MKLLLDENLSHKLVPRLAAAFPETAHVDSLGLHGQPDVAVWQYAAEHGFVIVSKDDDFRQLSFLRGHPPKVVWLTVGNAGTTVVAELLLRNHERVAAFVADPDDALLALATRAQDAL